MSCRRWGKENLGSRDPNRTEVTSLSLGRGQPFAVSWAQTESFLRTQSQQVGAHPGLRGARNLAPFLEKQSRIVSKH